MLITFYINLLAEKKQKLKEGEKVSTISKIEVISNLGCVIFEHKMIFHLYKSYYCVKYIESSKYLLKID